jgi:hypothetical protein
MILFMRMSSFSGASSPLRRSGNLGAALLVVALATGCGTPAGGDPGGKRLRELAADRVFAATPPSATGVAVRRVAAKYRKPSFEAGGWEGPTVFVTFADGAPVAAVYGFYARRAVRAGWRPLKRNNLGFTDAWNKTFPDGARATLTLFPVRLRYQLAGSISTV